MLQKYNSGEAYKIKKIQKFYLKRQKKEESKQQNINKNINFTGRDNNTKAVSKGVNNFLEDSQIVIYLK